MTPDHLQFEELPPRKNNNRKSPIIESSVSHSIDEEVSRSHQHQHHQHHHHAHPQSKPQEAEE
jgi:hypothetical protein